MDTTLLPRMALERLAQLVEDWWIFEGRDILCDRFAFSEGTQ